MLEKKLTPISFIIPLLCVVLFLGVLASSFISMDYEWDFSFLWPFVWDGENHRPGMILMGLWNTLWISLLSIVLGGILGTCFGVLLTSKNVLSRYAGLVYVDILRNTPLLVQFYVVFFIIGTAFELGAEQAGLLTMTLFCSAYVADIVRGTLKNFETGQIDAAKSLGFTPLQIARCVIFPLALRRILPALVGQFVNLVKDSSLLSVIGISELTKSASTIAATSFRNLETWFCIAIIYFLLNLVLSSFGRYLENRLNIVKPH